MRCLSCGEAYTGPPEAGLCKRIRGARGVRYVGWVLAESRVLTEDLHSAASPRIPQAPVGVTTLTPPK